ncbi:MAG: glucose 1-dehydrogenase [Geminicoccaceae bacterium]|nr:glucose 1-dehydrogenase [Geminicoccaceae bacterium]
MRLKNRRAIVTGGADGFGRGIAEAYACEGARLALLDIDGEGAERVARTIGRGALGIACDVADKASVDAAVHRAVDAMGGLDIVVNNAGTSHRNKPMAEVSEEEFDRLFAVNVKSIYLMTLATLPALRRSGETGGACIVNIGSTAGIRPRPGLTWYNASKGAVNLVSKSMAVELAPERIRVNCIAPVMGATALLETFMGLPDTPENRSRFVATIPWGRMSTADDVARAALYLAGDEAEMITGTVLQVDGGRCI